jgi:hypothetical protein
VSKRLPTNERAPFIKLPTIELSNPRVSRLGIIHSFECATHSKPHGSPLSMYRRCFFLGHLPPLKQKLRFRFKFRLYMKAYGPISTHDARIILSLFVGPHSNSPKLRAGSDLESGLKNGLGCKKSTPLIGREAGTRLFKFTP